MIADSVAGPCSYFPHHLLSGINAVEKMVAATSAVFSAELPLTNSLQ